MKFQKGQSGNCFTIENNVVNLPGIYKLTSDSGKIYIGSSRKMKRRGSEHKGNLKKKKHCNRYLQNAYNKHGHMTFSPLFYCEGEQLEEMEQKCIDTFKPEMNILKKAYNSEGYIHREETKKKMVELSRARAADEQWRDAVSGTWFKNGNKKLPNSMPIEDVSHLAHKATRKGVVATNLLSGEDFYFESVIDAAKFVGSSNRSCVSHRLIGRLLNKYKGFSFRYAIQ